MRSRAVFLLVAAGVLAALLAGCGGGGGSAYSSFEGGGSGGTEWTVMVFMNADNDLERFSLDNVAQMENVGSTDRVKIVVQWDRAPGGSIADGDWTDTRRYEIIKGGKTLITDMGEMDMGDPQVMKDFISWAENSYPANHYCLVIWNHGAGWRSIRPDTSPVTRNISFDDTSGTSVNTRDLPDIFRSAPKPIDVVAMDASLMQMAEVAYEVKGTAGLLVGSEDSPPGEGYVYDHWLSPLAANPTMDAQTLGKVIVDRYVQDYSGSFPVTQSVVDLSKAAGVGLAVDRFAAEIAPFAATQAAALKTARDDAQYYSYDDYKYKDLIDYAGKVTQALADQGVSDAYSALVQAVQQAVIYEGHTGAEDANSHGLTIWVPDPASYSLYSMRYQGLLFAQDTRWPEFLAAQVQ